MKIYSKTGDDGTTGLIGGSRTLKRSVRIDSIGMIDELNAIVGVARTLSEGDGLDPFLAKIQCWLFDAGAELACPPGGKVQMSRIAMAQIEALEQSIDAQTGQLPELRAFILPGGSPLAAHLHFARSVCRRAERSVLALHECEPVGETLRMFLNRLSDWLFVSARTANHSRSVNDIEWKSSEEL